MDPIEFPEVNLALVAPKGDEDSVREMPAYTDGEFCISCWQMSPEEIEQLKKNDGKLWLWVWSLPTSQPPVLIDVANPFEKQEGVDYGEEKEDEKTSNNGSGGTSGGSA